MTAHRPPPPGKPAKGPDDKKHDKKHDPKHDAGKHLLRAHEHLGRLEVLQGALGAAVPPSLALLRAEAERYLSAGDAHSAADLLRAAEHLGFAAAASKSPSASVTPELEQAVQREFEKKVEKAREHLTAEDSAIGKLALESLESARAALDERHFRKALEFARAAESLAGIEPHAESTPHKS